MIPLSGLRPGKSGRAMRVHDVNGSMQSLGGVEASRSLVRNPIPDVIVLECVSRCVNGASNMACVSACVEMDDGPTRTGNGNGEPGRPQRVNLATAPGSRNGAYEVQGAFLARPARASAQSQSSARTLHVGYEPAAWTARM